MEQQENVSMLIEELQNYIDSLYNEKKLDLELTKYLCRRLDKIDSCYCHELSNLYEKTRRDLLEDMEIKS